MFERVAADCFCASANRRRGIYIYIYIYTPVCKQELQNHECARSAERGTVNSFLEDKEPLEQGLEERGVFEKRQERLFGYIREI